MNVLPALLEDVADELGAERGDADGAREYRRAGVAFAASGEGGAEFRLRPDIAAAALRTPAVRPSERGQGWVRFEPQQLDQFGLDRATAWFEAAWREAAR
ncbi:MAG TPA: hypothetical protein VK592_07990 [Candidatus Dormibacteraeota bacterium]|nr:hypothetical protein [Candidatus Dormibacteraeota bacterium]